MHFILLYNYIYYLSSTNIPSTKQVEEPKMKKFTQLIVSVVSISFLAACISGEEKELSSGEQAFVPQVEVASVAQHNIASYHEFPGTIQAPESIELRPRISGYIEAVHFEEGSQVKAGDLLFSIDNGPFLAESNRLKAELAIAKSQFALAKKELERANILIQTNAIPKELLDARAASVKQNEANIASVTSALKAANLQLAYTQITAPISGVVSNAFITKGNYVNAGSSVLTNLVSNQDLHSYFDANQETLLAYKRANMAATSMPVLISIDNSDTYNIGGSIDFVDNRINTATGTIKARALINNDDGLLVPGLFVRIRVYNDLDASSILIKDEAIATDLSNKYVLVLNENNVVEYKAVTLGDKVAGLRVISSGLLPTDKIVVNGLQRVRPGTTVDPIEVEMASADSLAQISRTQTSVATLKKNIAEKQSIAANSDNQNERVSNNWVQARVSHSSK